MTLLPNLCDIFVYIFQRNTYAILSIYNVDVSTACVLSASIMHRAWILPTLFSLVSLASAKQSIENTAVLRTIELGGSLIHVTTAYAIKALDDDEVGSSLYTVALDKAQKTRTSWLSFKVKGGTTALQYVDLGCNDERCVSELLR